MPVEPSFLAGLTASRGAASGDTKYLLRSGESALPEERAALLRQWLDRCPREVSFSSGGPVIDTKATKLVSEAVAARVDHALRVVEACQPSSDWRSHPRATKWKRAAVTIGWFAQNRPNDLGPGPMARIADVDLNRLLAQGLAGLDEHNSEAPKAPEFALEVREVIRSVGAVDDGLASSLRWRRHCATARLWRRMIRLCWRRGAKSSCSGRFSAAVSSRMEPHFRVGPTRSNSIPTRKRAERLGMFWQELRGARAC